jgi:serine/threonine-protein kinase
MWATERNPDDRPVDARAMLDRLREIEKELGVYPHVVRAPAAGVVAVDDGADSGELTKVMPGTFTAPTVTETVDNSTRLRCAVDAERDGADGWWCSCCCSRRSRAEPAGGSGPDRVRRSAFRTCRGAPWTRRRLPSPPKG